MYKVPLKTNKNKHNMISKKVVLSVLLFMFYSLNTAAQCAMCRAVLETEDGGNTAEAVNDGIVYLMAFPYILVAIVGYVVYKSRLKKLS